MLVSFGALDMADANAIQYIQFHFAASHVTLIPDFILSRMLKHYRDYQRDGMSDGWITNEMKRKRIDITSGAYLLSDEQIAAFVAVLRRLQRGDLPANPHEDPSWSEAYSMGLGKALEKLPWGMILLGAGAFVFLSHFGRSFGATVAGK